MEAGIQDGSRVINDAQNYKKMLPNEHEFEKIQECEEIRFLCN
jgi:hypothetical protein